ncbi:hypothetical protein PDIDSM_5615 [Penicillium digitatum]|nr:hypothetical protein PDIDSM_5615 [Penicillium digitatum]
MTSPRFGFSSNSHYRYKFLQKIATTSERDFLKTHIDIFSLSKSTVRSITAHSNQTKRDIIKMSNSGINRQTTAVAEDTSPQPIPDNSVGGGEGWGDRLWLGGKEEGLGHKVVRDWGPVQRLPAYVDESGTPT